uniref:Ribosomal RNA small subunit methyltransferase NEP1 n=1 Tax=Rhabditophanes sp. KR3021 TaxID=114890 RepID=A0AC35UAT4_9BILA
MTSEEPPTKKLCIEEPEKEVARVDPTEIAKRKLIVVLEDCPLETAKVGEDYVILSSDKHVRYLLKHKKDPSEYRPDILHQCLLNLCDSPLNRAGLLQIYFRTKKNVCVEVSSQCRIPRTFDRFCGLMVQLLHKLQIRATDEKTRLLRVIKNPINDHLPVGCTKILMSVKATECIRPSQIPQGHLNENYVIVIGGISKGKIAPDYTDREVKINNYPLSAALACAKVTSGFEEAWDIL